MSYEIASRRPSLNAAIVMDHFGIGLESGRVVIADGLELPVRAGDVVCFTGASGSGKSSLLRAVMKALGAAGEADGRSPVVDVSRVEAGERLVIDAPGLPAAEAMRLLSACGLGEARLMLRRAQELSEGERYRLKLALALARGPAWIVADEFTATLDRTLAKVIAWNVRRLAERTGTGFMLATTHEDVLEDLRPSLHVRCGLDGGIEWRRREDGPSKDVYSIRQAVRQIRGSSGQWADGVELRPTDRSTSHTRAISLAERMSVTRGSRRDWAYFARWHYRGHRLPAVRFVTLLWDGESRVKSGESRAISASAPALDSGHSTLDATPIGVCVFTAPALALRERNRFFGLSARWSRLKFQALNRQLVTLARVVLHPAYRGAGIGAAFIRRSCELCPWPWIEAQTQMGHLNPVFERAGFARVGISTRKSPTRLGHSSIYGTKAGRHAGKSLVTPETFEKSRYARPVYYVFDNRGSARRGHW